MGHTHTIKTQSKLKVLLIALIIAFWWIGIWGLVETIIQPIIKDKYWYAIAIYSSIIVIIFLIVVTNANILEVVLKEI